MVWDAVSCLVERSRGLGSTRYWVAVQDPILSYHSNGKNGMIEYYDDAN